MKTRAGYFWLSAFFAKVILEIAYNLLRFITFRPNIIEQLGSQVYFATTLQAQNAGGKQRKTSRSPKSAAP